ncbi:mechanosensitive ion channel family protein [Candidatus Saccharibacteria bacterium]|nr:mechanosensitive ion channel family protein [Candidatus Saccharibacteria bacterium]MBQ3467934.1 mechanosensitive ion channel family protein [Candidatus Saccharibacteria bacterium]
MNLNFFGTDISLKKLINSALYIVFVLIVYLILRRVLRVTFIKAGGKKASPAQKQRIKTISQMLSSILRYLFLIIVLLVVLSVLGVNVTSLLAGLGILTAVIGLAFQDMIKDFIAGIAIIAENQFSVGDTVIVQADGFKGVVTNIGLKTTEITNEKGEVKILANHNIDGLINCSRQS